MKMVKAIIKPERFEFVKKALEDKGFIGMTITDVKGRGEQKGITLEYRGGLMTVDFLPKIQLEIVVRDSDVDNLVVTITEAARTERSAMVKYSSCPLKSQSESAQEIWKHKNCRTPDNFNLFFLLFFNCFAGDYPGR